MKKVFFVILMILTILISLLNLKKHHQTSVTKQPDYQSSIFSESDLTSYKKPSDEALRLALSPLSYQVTQKEGTENPSSSEYAESTAEGIYVDIVSGEPLFSSKDKYDSGTGWPSFVKPITTDALNYKTDSSIGEQRIEVRSRYSNSHLGHVFDDGPKDRGGKRYCMNGAALRFVPKADMEKQGYSNYLKYI